MEKERAYKSVSFCVIGESRGFSAIGVTAAISALVLVTAVGWQTISAIQTKNAATSYVARADTHAAEVDAVDPVAALEEAMSSSGSSPLGDAILDEVVSRYVGLQEQGLYTPEVGASVGEKMAQELKPSVAHTTYTVADILSVTDTSYNRMLEYRSDLQESLAPLLKNTQLEFEIFARYVDTKDPTYLAQLKEAARNYRDAAGASARLVVPKDAAMAHVAILNAMQEFAAVLEALAANATDPFASVALLRTYNEAEQSMLTSFDALAAYYKQKQS